MLQTSQATRGLALLALCSAPLAAVQEDAPSRREAVLAAIEEPLVVDGVEIAPYEIRRALARSAGTQLIELAKMDLFVQEEIERQVRAGKSRDEFQLSDEEIAGQVENTFERLEEEYPGADLDDVLGARGMGTESLSDQVARTAVFDRVFLPENPHEWPDTTIAAIQSQAGQQFIDKLIEGWDARQESGEAQDPNDPGHLMWKNIMRQFVLKALNDSAEIVTQGLDPKVLLEIDGRQVMTDQVFQQVLDSGRLSPHDVKMTRLWFAKVTALENELKERGAWVDDEEFAELWEAEEEPYRNSPFNLQVIAVGFRKFPSIEAYKRYYRILKSYEGLIADEINDENLGEHMDRANPMLGLAKVRADIILISAFEFGGGRFAENGWEDARVRAAECAEALAAGMPWDEAVEKYSDFKDPLVPESQKGQAPPSFNKGRFPLLHRNELVQRVGESDFWMFLSGGSVVDYAFFDQPVGTIDGPFEGIMGYYITKVIQRTKPTKLLSLEDESQRALITQDYVAVRLNEFAEEVLAEAEVSQI